MLVTEAGIVTDVRPLQPENAWTPMFVTESGIVTDVRPLQLEKAWAPMLVTVSGITQVPIAPAGHAIIFFSFLLTSTPLTISKYSLF